MDSQPGWVFTVLVSGSDLLKHLRGTHSLDASGHSTILVSGSDLLKHWRLTHILDGCSPILISDFDLLKHWKIDSLPG